MSKYLCNLVVPGFPKSGTSSLHSYLDQHPDVCMSLPKESHYFAVTSKWKLGEDSHNALFSHCGRQHRYYGESSTIYCICEDAANRIRQALNAPKIILLLRDPVERLISHYNWLYKLGLESRPILEAVKENGRNFDPDCPIPGSGNYMAYLAFSEYSKYIPMWQSLFGEDNVKIVLTDNISKFPLLAVNECFEFLGLPVLNTVRNTALNKTNDARNVFRRKWAAHIESSIPQSLVSFAAKNEYIKKLWRQCAHASKIISPPVISEREINKLRELLRNDVDCYNSYSCTTGVKQRS